MNNRPSLFDFTLPILDQMRSILADRGESYTDFQDNTQVWYDLMKAVGLVPDPLPPGFTPAIYCGMAYKLMKLSRLAVNPTHMDSWLDDANYGVLTAGIIQRTAQMVEQAMAAQVQGLTGKMMGYADKAPVTQVWDPDDEALYNKILCRIREDVSDAPT